MNYWKSIYGCLFAVLFIPLCFAAANDSPAGNWTTIDDKTGQKRAVVHITVSNGILSGRLIKVYPQPGDTGTCAKCPGAFRGKKVIGLQILWGLKDRGNGVWDNGQILDPKNGKIYRAKATLEGNKLIMRGYIGISAFGRNQTWFR